MLPPAVRFALIFAAAALGGWWLTQGRILGGVLSLLGAGVLLLGHFIHGTIHAALRAHRQGDLEKTAALLASIRPERLTAGDRGYYHLLHGLLHLEAGRVEEGRAALELAEQLVRPESNRRLVQRKLLELSLLGCDRVL